MAKKKDVTPTEPFHASEVREWLGSTGESVGARGRIAVAKHRAYLDARPERAREIAKLLGTMPKNNQPKDKDWDTTALLMARPSLVGKPLPAKDATPPSAPAEEIAAS